MFNIHEIRWFTQTEANQNYSCKTLFIIGVVNLEKTTYIPTNLVLVKKNAYV